MLHELLSWKEEVAESTLDREGVPQGSLVLLGVRALPVIEVLQGTEHGALRTSYDEPWLLIPDKSQGVAPALRTIEVPSLAMFIAGPQVQCYPVLQPVLGSPSDHPRG